MTFGGLLSKLALDPVVGGIKNRGLVVENIEEILINSLGEKFGNQPELDDSLLMLGIDSVGMAELTYDIEQRFKISIDDTLLDVDTVQDLANYIRQKQSQQAQQ